MLTSPRKPSVHYEDDGTIDVEPEDSVLQVVESVSVTSSSTFIARQIKLNKKRAEFEARHAFAKAEAKHALEIAKAEEQLKIATAKLDAEERLIALSERGSSVAVSRKAGPINSSIKLMGWRSDFCEAFLADSKTARKENAIGILCWRKEFFLVGRIGKRKCRQI